MKPELIDVVAAVRMIVAEDGRRYWLCRRGEGRENAGLWEYPGGKVEPNERPREALVRELTEEFEMPGDELIHVGADLGTVEHGRYRVTFYEVNMVEPTALRCHSETRWMSAEEILASDHHQAIDAIFSARNLAK